MYGLAPERPPPAPAMPNALLPVSFRRALSRAVPAAGALAAVVALGAPAARPAAAQRSAAPSTPAAPTIGLVRDARLAALLDDVRPARLRADDSTLVAFGTRHTMSDTLSATRGIGAARRWLYGQLRDVSRGCGGCLRVEYDAAPLVVARHPQRPTVNVVNVLAWLPGRDTSRVVVLGGHYDSCVCSVNPMDSTSDAPGADDDGSGTAAVLELARAFAARYPRGLEATVVFALFAAEEQGLLGSTHLAARLRREGYRVDGAITNDIVGNVEAEDGRRDATTVRVFAPDPENGPAREFARMAWAVGALYQPAFRVLPVWRLDRIGRGGDHAPFARQGDPAIRFTERLENYKRQHLPTDDLAHVDFDYVARVARLNGALVGALASAPAAPSGAAAARDRESGGQRWRMTWQPVAGAASYEVLVRATSAPTWERVIPVGAGTSYLLEDQLDDVWAGVRAVGANGHRSLASVVPGPPRAAPPAEPAPR